MRTMISYLLMNRKMRKMTIDEDDDDDKDDEEESDNSNLEKSTRVMETR